MSCRIGRSTTVALAVSTASDRGHARVIVCVRKKHKGRRHVRQPAVLSALEQPSENFDLRVRQSTGERHVGRLHAGCRGTVPESAQSRLVRVQPVSRGKYTVSET